ncbi:DOMON-like domain-containing protein [Porphyrobacter sp. GA68]|uniref:DOMON-like domain-containing protein n=1 Tax=Porphyrobacter sp. GA68 TaxID=2883480 RepID=UPI001D192119|nr:DOMON-like domain-containing protein [Porphyrobacter sp. GA68]
MVITDDEHTDGAILTPHPAHPPLLVGRVAVMLDARDPHWLRLRWRIEGAQRLCVPRLTGRRRADELWRTTCFELFVQPEGGSSYQEWNFSPSQSWASYDFVGCRSGMTAPDVPRPPVITWRGGASGLRLMDVAIARAGLPPLPWRYGLTAVLEEEGGRVSFWAAVHRAEKPDFHDPACFTGRLAAPAAA